MKTNSKQFDIHNILNRTLKKEKCRLMLTVLNPKISRIHPFIDCGKFVECEIAAERGKPFVL